MGDKPVDDMAADNKVEPLREGTPSSVDSDVEDDIDGEPLQEPIQPQKRKGGRKPVSPRLT